MLSRRSIMAAGASVTAASSLGLKIPEAEATPLVHDVSDHPLMKNVRQYLDDLPPALPEIVGVGVGYRQFVLTLNAALIIKHGDELFPDPERFMTSPVMNYKGRDIVGRSKNLRTRLVLSMPLDGSYVLKFDHAAPEMIRALTTQIYGEFLQEMATNKRPIHPFIPVLSFGLVIDPTTLTPTLNFKTRFGVDEQMA